MATAFIADRSIATLKQSSVHSQTWSGKVAECGKVTLGARIYPHAVLRAAVAEANERASLGRLLGSIDGPSLLGGGSLRRSPIVWKKLWMAADGSAMGDFQVISDHSFGKDVLQQLEAGMSVGVGLQAHAEVHRPSPAERLRYELPEECDDDFRLDQEGDRIYVGATVASDVVIEKINLVDAGEATCESCVVCATTGTACQGNHAPPPRKAGGAFETLARRWQQNDARALGLMNQQTRDALEWLADF